MKKFLLFYTDNVLRAVQFEMDGERHFSADVFVQRDDAIHVGYSGTTYSPADEVNSLEKSFNRGRPMKGVTVLEVEAEPYNTHERAAYIHYLTFKIP